MNVKFTIILIFFSYMSFSQDYTVSVDADVTIGYASPKLFGTNLVHERNFLDDSFKNNMTNLKMQTLRYPGGTVTEHLFEPGYKVDAGVLNDYGPLSDTVLTPDEQELKAFLDYCKAENIEPILVVPTKRYVQQEDCNYTNCDSQNGTYTGALLDSIADAAKRAAEFVRRVNVSNRYGDHNVQLWEIGNEYYVDGPEVPVISTWRYKMLAVAFADEMHAMDNTIKLLINHAIAKQDAIDELAAYFDQPADDNPAERKGRNVDGVIIHAYPWMPQESSGSISQRLAAADSNIDGVKGNIQYATNAFGLPAYITEWNINSKGENFPGGMIGANLMPMLFQNIVESGAVFATQWPMSWKNNFIWSRLANLDGTLTPNGQSWDWLATYGMNKDLVEGIEISGPSSSESIKVLPFVDESELTLLIMCRQGKSNGSLRINVEGFDIAQVTSAERMTRANPTVRTNATAASYTNISPAYNSINNYLYLTINKDNPWEIIRITCSGMRSSAPAFLENIGRGKKMKSTSSDDDVFLKGLADAGEKGKWKFEPVGNGYYFIVNEENNMRLRGKNTNVDDPASIHLIDDTNSGSWVQWELTPVGDDFFIDNVGHDMRLRANGSDSIVFADKSSVGTQVKWRRNFSVQPNARVGVLEPGATEAEFEQSFSLYPNPAQSHIDISYELSTSATVHTRLCDLLGKSIVSTEERALPSGQHHSTLDLSSIKKGIYIVEATVVQDNGDRKKYIRKIIKK